MSDYGFADAERIMDLDVYQETMTHFLHYGADAAHSKALLAVFMTILTRCGYHGCDEHEEDLTPEIGITIMGDFIRSLDMFELNEEEGFHQFDEVALLSPQRLFAFWDAIAVTPGYISSCLARVCAIRD